MVSIERLFLLVHSLSKSEKRYFRLESDLQKGKKNYILLFEALERSPVFDETLKQSLAIQFPNNSLETPRKHLYKVIMKSLRQFESKKDIEASLMNLLHDTRILYKKGLTNLSIKQLTKLKKLSLKHERHDYYILAAKQELQYLVNRQFMGLTEKEVLKKLNTVKDILEDELHIARHAALNSTLLLRYYRNGPVRSKSELIKLNDLVLEENHILNTYRNNSFESERIHLNFQSTYFLMTGSPESSLKIYYELERLLQRHRLLWKDNPLYYLRVLDGILTNLRLTENHKEMEYFLERLQLFKTSVPGLENQIDCAIYAHTLTSMLDRGDLVAAQKRAKAFGAILQKRTKGLTAKQLAGCHFLMARGFFAYMEYPKALHHINQVLNQPLSVKTDYYVRCGLLQLQIYTLQKKYDLLEYVMRSLERKLKLERKLFGVEQLILKTIKRKINYRPLRDTNDAIAVLEKNPFEYQLIKDFEILLWINRLLE